MKLQDLPAPNAPLDGGTFAGLTTLKDGTHCAVVLLPARGEGLTWQQAMDWAKEQGGELPTRSAAALIFANVQDRPQEGWHWTNEEYSALYAWRCNCYDGGQRNYYKSRGSHAIAVIYMRITP